MLKWISDKLVIILSALLLSSLLGATIVSKLYIESQKDLASLTEKHRAIQGILDSCSKSKDNLIESGEATDEVVTNIKQKLLVLQSEQETALVALDSLKNKQCQPRQLGDNRNVPDNEVQLDSRLGDELSGLLDKVHKRGSTNLPTR